MYIRYICCDFLVPLSLPIGSALSIQFDLLTPDAFLEAICHLDPAGPFIGGLFGVPEIVFALEESSIVLFFVDFSSTVMCSKASPNTKQINQSIN
jgi:hypothetical protein